MIESPRQTWVYAAVLAGVGYALVGIVFAVPTTHVRAWRLAAWVVSAVGYAAHIAYERFRLRNTPATAAWHVALGAALGGFGLAVGANIHSLFVVSSQSRPLLLPSLAIWPVITGLPAFVVALGVSAALGRIVRSHEHSDQIAS